MSINNATKQVFKSSKSIDFVSNNTKSTLSSLNLTKTKYQLLNLDTEDDLHVQEVISTRVPIHPFFKLNKAQRLITILDNTTVNSTRVKNLYYQVRLSNGEISIKKNPRFTSYLESSQFLDKTNDESVNRLIKLKVEEKAQVFSEFEKELKLFQNVDFDLNELKNDKIFNAQLYNKDGVLITNEEKIIYILCNLEKSTDKSFDISLVENFLSRTKDETTIVKVFKLLSYSPIFYKRFQGILTSVIRKFPNLQHNVEILNSLSYIIGKQGKLQELRGIILELKTLGYSVDKDILVKYLSKVERKYLDKEFKLIKYIKEFDLVFAANLDSVKVLRKLIDLSQTVDEVVYVLEIVERNKLSQISDIGSLKTLVLNKLANGRFIEKNSLELRCALLNRIDSPAYKL